jgi:hypothetical protein
VVLGALRFFLNAGPPWLLWVGAGLVVAAVILGKPRLVTDDASRNMNRVGTALFLLGIGGCVCWSGFGYGYPWFQWVGAGLTIVGSVLGRARLIKHDRADRSPPAPPTAG